MIRLTVLGSCGTYPAPGRACSGYLLEGPAGRGVPAARPTRVWVDAGPGTLANLLRLFPLQELDAIWISHLHPDHCSDLTVAYHYLRFGPQGPPAPGSRKLPVYGPAGWREHFNRFLAAPGPDAGCDKAAPPDRVGVVFEPHELTDGAAVQVGGLALTAARTYHSVETYGLRASDGERVLAFSADAGPTDELRRLARDVDLFVCEASWERQPPGLDAIHCSYVEAGQVAAEAGARRLILTHMQPQEDPERALGQARQAYGGAVRAAREGDVYHVGGERG